MPLHDANRGSKFRFHPTVFRQIPALAAAFLTLVVSCLIEPKPIHAQQEMKWGEVPRADLEMTKFEADTNATAVILGDLGVVEFRNDFAMEFTRHLRIKILTEAGYEWGKLQINYYAEDHQQRVEDVAGHTITVGADGKLKREKLDKKSMFDEDVDGEWRRVNLALPSLKPGCVVEYRYRVVSRYATFLPNWRFQTSEPTRWSEFRAQIPGVLQYVIVMQGILGFAVQEVEHLNWPPLLQNAATANQYGIKIMSHRWAMKDMPALRREPYMTTTEDHVAKIHFQLAKITWPQQASIEVMDSWEKLAKDLWESQYFGAQIERHKVLKQQAEAVVAGLTDPEQKMNAIHAYVRNTMKSNDEYGIYVDQDLDKSFQTRQGTVAEIQLILISMLRAAGLEAQPVLISTRDHGHIIESYSILRQFNHVLACVKIGTKEILLDATDPLCPASLLPDDDVNERGWLVDKKQPRWVKIPSTGQSSNQTFVTATLAADGAITGRFESIDEGYSALRDRHTLSDKKEEDYVRDGWLSDFTGAQLDSFSISNRDSVEKPLLTKAYFSSNEFVQVAGDNIYLNPVFFGRREDNPLKQPKRTFPVDYGYATKYVYLLSLQLPEGYTVQEAPPNVLINLPGEAGLFRRLVQVDGTWLQVKTEMQIRKSLFAPQEYSALRDFYSRIITAHAEQVVLKRNVSSAGN